jgi:hypothetical protein
MGEMDEVELARHLLAGTNPVPARALAGAADRPQARALRDRVLRTQRDPSVPLGPRRRRVPRRVRMTLLVAACVAVLAAGVVVASPWGPTTPAVAATPPILDFGLVGHTPFGEAKGIPAASALLRLADGASARTADARSGSVAYVRTDNWFFSATVAASGSSSAVRPSTVETWTAPDGASIRRERSGAPLLLEGALPPDTGIGAVVTASFPAGTEVRPLADDLARAGQPGLRAALLTAAGCSAPDRSDSTCLLQGAAMLHDQQVVPPAVDSGLWRMLAAERDLVTLGDVVDRAGRPAVAITTSLDAAAPVRCVLLVDPLTGTLLGTELIAMSSDSGYVVTVPAVVGFTAYMASGWATSLPS